MDKPRFVWSNPPQGRRVFNALDTCKDLSDAIRRYLLELSRKVENLDLRCSALGRRGHSFTLDELSQLVPEPVNFQAYSFIQGPYLDFESIYQENQSDSYIALLGFTLSI